MCLTHPRAVAGATCLSDPRAVAGATCLSEPPAVAGGPRILMWNDTDIPLAHLITFRCYGTWLHGDERGAVDRLHNRYKAPFARASQRRHEHNRKLLKAEAVILNANQRSSVENAIRET